MKKDLQQLRKEYLYTHLDENEMDAYPFHMFDRWFQHAVEAGVKEPNAMVLSTAGHGGRVSSRVVLLKNLDQGKFLFFTNYESRKGIQISQNPWASLLFFWADEERQVRVEGRVSRISRSKSVAYFNERPLESRISAVVSPQSSTIPDRMFLEVMRDGVILDLDGKSPVCPKNWGGYQLRPLLFEFWQGRANRLHDRIQYRFAGKRWLRERLAP